MPLRRSAERRAGAPLPTDALVVHIIDELKVGGAQTHLVTMLRGAIVEFPALRHRVVSLYGDGAVGDEIRALGVPVDVLDLRAAMNGRRFRAAAGEVEALLRDHRPDLVEAHLTYSRLVGLFAAWRAGVPRRWAFEHGDLYLDAPKFRVAHFLGQHLATRVVVVSHALQGWARATYRLSPRRALVLHNCVDLERFARHRHAASPDVVRAPGETLFVSVGTLGRGVNKRMDVCIRAVAGAQARGAAVGLVICGDGELRPELERLADELGVRGAVRFLGMRGDVPAVLLACDAYCQATAFEPLGIACLEAMAMGLPAVVPDAGGIVEVVEHGRTGLISRVLDADALADAMCRLHEHPEERAALGRAAGVAVRERSSVPAYVRRLYAAYGLVKE